MIDGLALARRDLDAKALTTAPPKRRSFTDHWRRRADAMARSRDGILDARDLESGDLVVTSPDAVYKAGGGLEHDPYSSRIPQRWQVPLNLEQQIADLMCDILREPSSGSEAADTQAQKTEACLRGAIEQLLPWRDSVGKAVRESEWAAYLLPASAAWERRPTWMDAQSETIRKRWWLGSDGKPVSDRKAVDRARSYKTFEEARQRYCADHLPATYRLISALDCVPTFTRGWGKRRLELTSLMVRTLYDVEELLADGYQTRDGLEKVMVPTGYRSDNLMGANGMLYLYEWFYAVPNPDDPDDRIPMVSYSVAGLETWNSRMRSRDEDDPAEATINLRERYGLKRHLMGYYWGFQRSGEDDPARKGIPMMKIWEDTILGIESNKMAVRKHANESSFRGYQFIPDSDIPAEAYLAGTDGARTLRQFPLPGSGEGVTVPGKWEPVAPAPMGAVVQYIIESDMALLDATLPDKQQFGGEGASSGHELSVSHALFQSANSHVKEGLRQQVEDLAEWVLELFDAIMEHFDLDGIPISSNQPITADATPGRRTPRERLTLTRGMIGGDYEVTAFYPDVGNLAEVAQENALRKDGMSTFDRVAEKMGVNDPFTLRVEVERDKFLDSPQGAALKAIWLARYRGDEEAAKKLIEAGALNPDGETPMAGIAPESMQAASGAVGRMMGGGGMGQGAMPGEQALGGINAGALSTGALMNDAVATSRIPDAPQARMVGG